MMPRSHSTLRRSLLWGGLAVLASVAPAIAQSANFDGITLSTYPPSTAEVTGRTVGTYALGNIAGRDRDGKPCTGFADTNPDHILVLQNDFPTLTVQVTSGRDTTLLIQGPDDNTIRCGQDISRRDLDAIVQGEDWRTGTYRIWVGTHDQGQRFNYTLSVSE